MGPGGQRGAGAETGREKKERRGAVAGRKGDRRIGNWFIVETRDGMRGVKTNEEEGERRQGMRKGGGSMKRRETMERLAGQIKDSTIGEGYVEAKRGEDNRWNERTKEN